MADIYISESDMMFGPFPTDRVFCIEKSDLYEHRYRQNGIKTCEFILLRDGKLYFVEAKKSCPNHNAQEENEEKRIKYDAYIRDIPQKMRDSLDIYSSLLLKKNGSADLPTGMMLGDLSEHEIRLVLVVKNAQKDWLKHYQEKFQEILRREMRIWKIPSFIVLTEDDAKKKHLIS